MITVNPFFQSFGITNNYIVTDEESRDAILIDCTDVDMAMIDFIEDGKYRLQGVFLTHAHEHHVSGLLKLQQTATPDVFSINIKSGEGVFLSFFRQGRADGISCRTGTGNVRNSFRKSAPHPGALTGQSSLSDRG